VPSGPGSRYRIGGESQAHYSKHASRKGYRARLLLATYRERRRTHFARPPTGRWNVGQSLVIVHGEL
jgi:hypothetical protein